MSRILLIDLSANERKARDQLNDELAKLNLMQKAGTLRPDREKRHDQLAEFLDNDMPVDALYQAVISKLKKKPWSEIYKDGPDKTGIHLYGLFESQRKKAGPAAELTEDELRVAGVYGLMQIDTADPTRKDFDDLFGKAALEYENTKPLFKKAIKTLAKLQETKLEDLVDDKAVHVHIAGCVSDGDKKISVRAKLPAAAQDNFEPHIEKDEVQEVSARKAAEFVRRLAAKGLTGAEPFIARLVEDFFRDTSSGIDGAAPSTMEIVLPELEEAVDVEVQKENLHALQAIYFVHMLEEMRIFQVVERIVELFRAGLIPLGRGTAGDFLFNYYRKAAERITESERRDLYQRAFGAPGGTPSAEANREFNELWLRFISAVSSYVRQNTVERLLRSAVPSAVSAEQIRKAGRDLAVNLSRNGFGIAYFAATELQQTIIEFKNVLQNADLKSALGARDMFQVIDIINVNYLGGARNTHRYRTQAKAGAVIIRWLANNYPRLSAVSGEVLSRDELANPPAEGAGHKPMENPSDSDLVNACEQWLSVAGVQDESIEQYSQPIESPTMTSRPIDMPQARDALAQFGVSLPEI
jgi:hypothetical protein